MKSHRFDPISFLFGVVVIVVGIAATNRRLGTVLNDRPDEVIPLLVLAAGLVAVAIAAKRGANQRSTIAGDDQQT